MSPAPYRPPTPPRPMGPQMGRDAARRASAAAGDAARRATAAHHQNFAQRRGPRRRRSAPVRLVGLVLKLAFVAVWLVFAALIVAFAIQQSKGL